LTLVWLLSIDYARREQTGRRLHEEPDHDLDSAKTHLNGKALKSQIKWHNKNEFKQECRSS